MDMDLSVIPFLQRQSVRDLMRNHDALRREVSALVALNTALVQDLRTERQEALELLREKSALSKESEVQLPVRDRTLHSTNVYEETLRDVQREIEVLGNSIENLQGKVAGLHQTRVSLEDAKLQSRLESWTILEKNEPSSVSGGGDQGRVEALRSTSTGNKASTLKDHQAPVAITPQNSSDGDATVKTAVIAITGAGDQVNPSPNPTRGGHAEPHLASKSHDALVRTLRVPFRMTVLPDPANPRWKDRFMNIVMMPEYQGFSPEELRWNDYQIDEQLARGHAKTCS